MVKKEKNSLISTKNSQWWLINDPNSISYKFIGEITKVCCYLPKSIRKSIFSFIDSFVISMSRLFLIFSQLSLNTYLVSGEEKHSGEMITILFLGNENPSPYILEILFSETPRIKKQFNTLIWNCQKKVNRIFPNINAIFIKSDRFYSNFFEKKGFTIIPEWISMTLDISGSLDEVYKRFSKGTKEDLKKIKKYDYKCEISNDDEKLKSFYNNMYIPYISWKFGDTGVYANFYAIKHIFERGSKLLFIKLDDKYLFGGLFRKDRDKIFASYAGVMEDKFDFIQKGVITASYHHLIQKAKESGVNIVDFGYCRPFINDGVFAYKRKWGTKIEKAGNDSADIFSFKICNNSKGMSSFLAKNPFVYLEKNKLNSKACKKNNV